MSYVADGEAIAARLDSAGGEQVEKFGMERPIVEAEDEFRDAGPKKQRRHAGNIPQDRRRELKRFAG